MDITTKATKKYNDIMWDLCREHLTIGTRLSEGTDNWTLRDMVSEMQYTLDIYDDPGCIYWEDAHDVSQPGGPGGEWYRQWYNEKARMRRFIERYKDEALQFECFENHCSKYD